MRMKNKDIAELRCLYDKELLSIVGGNTRDRVDEIKDFIYDWISEHFYKD